MPEDAPPEEPTHPGNNKIAMQQIGYRRHPLGVLIHMMSLVTLFGWQPLLVVLYNKIRLSENEERDLLLLEAFLVTVIVGFIWCSILYLPHRLEYVFLRRCELADASFVAVYLYNRAEDKNNNKEGTPNPLYQQLMNGFSSVITLVMKLVYANDELRDSEEAYKLEYCKVQSATNGSRYISFLIRRYNYSSVTKLFEPGHIVVGHTLSDIVPRGLNALDIEVRYEKALADNMSVNQDEDNGYLTDYLHDVTGLTDAQVRARLDIVGRNIINIEKPSYLRILRQEASKLFYLYQTFALWNWIIVDYWLLPAIIWLIVVFSALLISYFRFRGASVLYQLSHVSGTSRVLRGGELVSMDQSALVPGDLVALTPGIIHADMVLCVGEVVADESALTGEATPQAKTPIDFNSQEVYDPRVHKKQSLSAGTKIEECRDALAVVVNTGSYTRKGEINRDMIAFRNHKLQYELDLPVAVSLLCVYSFCMLLTVVHLSGGGVIGWILGM